VAAAHQINPQSLTRTHEITQLFLSRLRHSHKRQLVGEQQPREPLGVTPVGLMRSRARRAM
jgi:hypothetical protein